METSPQIARVVLYVRNIAKVAAFYELHFGMRQHGEARAGWLELSSEGGGCTIALHKAAVSQRSGAAVKVVFGVKDVRAFRERCEKNGLLFGPVHEPDGFAFANAQDPAGNSISISSRGLV